MKGRFQVPRPVWWGLAVLLVAAYFGGADLFSPNLGLLFTVPVVMVMTVLAGQPAEFAPLPPDEMQAAIGGPRKAERPGLFYRRARTRADWIRASRQAGFVGVGMLALIGANAWLTGPH